jgi:hypothetical protein
MPLDDKTPHLAEIAEILAAGCVFQRKAATDSKGRRAGFQLKAATTEVV